MTHSAEVNVKLDGKLTGFTAVVKFKLADGRVLVDNISYQPTHPMPLNSATASRLKDLRLGDIIGNLENGLETIGAAALPWIEAIASERRRPGRHGTHPLSLAEIAAKRVEAEEKAPGNAIRYMRQHWPKLVGETDAAVSGRLNRTINARGGPMLERDGNRRWHLTPRAVDLLRDHREEPP